MCQHPDLRLTGRNNYSARSAIWGSTRVARRAGTSVATRETIATSDRLSTGELVTVGSFTRVLDIGLEVLDVPAKDVFVIRFDAE